MGVPREKILFAEKKLFLDCDLEKSDNSAIFEELISILETIRARAKERIFCDYLKKKKKHIS